MLAERYDSEQAVAELQGRLGAKVYEHDVQVQEQLCAMDEHIGKLQARLISSGAHMQATTPGNDKADGPSKAAGCHSYRASMSNIALPSARTQHPLYFDDDKSTPLLT